MPRSAIRLLAGRGKKKQDDRVSELLQRIENAVHQRRLLACRQKILVAVSGGADSMVLLHLLHSLARKNRWQISVAHLNHRLRGRASQADEQLVRQTAAGLGLQFFGGGAEVKKIAARSKISIEMAARKLRHEFLARTAREQKIAVIALAHHADDQVELFFLRLLRGAGGEGVAGMKWRSLSPADRMISLVRPLLDCAKAELMAFAREHKIRFRDDATNFSSDFLRNRIRNELLPLLRKRYQPGLDKTVLRLMDIVGAEAAFVSEAAGMFCADRGDTTQVKTGDRQPTIGNKSDPGGHKFDDWPLAIQRKVLQQQLTGFGLMADFELIEQLRKVSGKQVSVAPGLSVARDAEGKVSCRENPASEFNAANVKLKLSGKAGRGQFAGRNFAWRVEVMKEFRLPRKKLAGGSPALRECFDADKIGDEIILRHWQPGDRFQPIGLKTAVKLQDLFVNGKISAVHRRELVLAATKAGQIFWVEGLRIGELFKLTPNTRRKLVWHV